MSSVSSILSRTSTLMQSDQLLAALRNTQSELMDTQRQITTGKQVDRPSDDPSRVSAILFLRQSQAAREQYDENLQNALGVLNTIDTSLADGNAILLESRSIAQSQIGIGSDADTRRLEADVIDAQLTALIDVANRQFNKLSLFGGNAGAAPDADIFEQFLGGLRYTGSATELTADVGGVRSQAFTSNGFDAFGALSSRVRSLVDLNPNATAATRLSAVRGVQSLGVRSGTVQVTVNGSPTTLDLSGAETMGDVVTRINNAIDGLAPGAGSLSIGNSGFELGSTPGNTVSIVDVGNGETAADLGIDLSAAGGATDTGGDIGPMLTQRTQLSELGTAVDFASGLQITQGDVTKVADFSTAQTVQDLQNVIKGLNLGLRLTINESGNGLDMISEVSGLTLSVGENGGSTATDLGLRTLDATTELGDFRDGLGIEPVDGEDDIELRLHDGTRFTVDATGLSTVSELVTAIETAAAGAGLTVGADFEVDYAATGNGLVFTDNTVGGDDFVVSDANTSLVATQLGIKHNAGAANSFTSDDASRVRVDSVFTHLMELRDSLLNDDTLGITLAGDRLEGDLERMTQARAMVGVNAKRVEDAQTRSEDLSISEQTMLSELQDADLTEVITRFSQLQQQLQASMQVAAQSLRFSLLDFLR